jgi:hypothetical protein
MDSSQNQQDQDETQENSTAAEQDIPSLNREELGREQELLRLVFQKQQRQMGDIRKQLGDGVLEDIELSMSLEVQSEILEEKMGETHRLIQQVTARLELLEEPVEELEELQEEPVDEELDAEDGSGEALENELDQLLDDVSAPETEELGNLDADISDIVSGLTQLPQEQPEEDDGEVDPQTQATTPVESIRVDPLIQAREALQKAELARTQEAARIAREAQRKKLSKSMLSEMEQASTDGKSLREPTRRRYRQRSDMEPQPLSQAVVEKRKRVKASSLKSATVLSFKKCEKCGAVVPANFKICGRCGSMLKSLCPSCGAHIPRGVEYCSSCNKRVMY